MESKTFLEQLKGLEMYSNIDMENIEAKITNIEEVEYNLFKLSVIIEKVEYDGLYTENKQKPIFQFINILQLTIMKQKELKGIKLLIKECEGFKTVSKTLHRAQILLTSNNTKKKYFDLLYDIPKLLSNEKEKYDSDFFIYNFKKDDFIVLTSFEKLNEYKAIIYSVDKNYINDIKKFFDEISDGTIIYIENFLMKNGILFFTNFTTYDLANGEYLADYFKKKYNKEDDYYKLKIYYDVPIKQKYDSNYLFIKVIYINDKYLIGIDQYPKLYKIKKSNEKLNQINDIYTLILLRNYEILFSDDISIIKLHNNSSIYISLNLSIIIFFFI